MPTPPAPKPRPRRRWFRRLAIVALLLLLIAGAAPLLLVYYYTRPAQVIPVAEQALEQLTGCDVSVDHARVSRSGKVEIEGIVFRIPSRTGDYATIAQVRRLDLYGEAGALLDGSYQPTRVEIRGLTLWLTEDLERQSFNFEELILPDSGDDGTAEASIPTILLEDGVIRFGQRDGETVKPLGEIHVQGGLDAEQPDKRLYNFALHETLGSGLGADPDGAAFTGRFSLAEPRLDLTVDRFSLAQEQRYFVPGEFRALWSRLAPVGEVTRLVLHVGPDEANRFAAAHATLEMDFEGIGLNLDILGAEDPDLREAALLLTTVESRLTDLRGRLLLENGRWRFEDAAGRMRQVGIGLSTVDYHIDAEGGLSLDEPYHIHIDTEPFTLRDRFEFLLAFSPLTGEAYRRFRPSGEFALSADFVSEQGQAQPDWSIQLHLRDARIVHEMFPLPLDQMRGTIDIADEQVRINPITARTPSGGRVTLSGTATPASDIAEVRLTVDIEDLPIDEHLREVLKPGERDNLDRFLSPRLYRSLTEQGLISADGTGAPRFVLGGTVDVHVPVYRGYGEDGEYSIVPEIDLAGVSALMDDFPYPVTVTRGSVAIGPDFVVVDRMELMGLTGGALTVDGRADKDAESGEYLPSLMVSDGTLPIDGLLLAAIGGEARELLTDLRVGGMLRITGPLEQEPGDDDVRMAMDVVLSEGTANPFGGAVTLTDIGGALQLHTGAIRDLRFTGRWRDGASLTVEGSVDWATRDPATGGPITTADLLFTAERFFFTRDLLGLLPGDSETHRELAELFDLYEPEGVFDARLHWRPTSVEDAPDDYAAWVTPDTIALNLLGGRLTLNDVDGRAHLTPESLNLESMTGTFTDTDGATGRLSASGTIHIADKPDVSLRLEGESSAIGQTARLLLPDTTLEVLDTIAWQGGFAMRDAHLEMTGVGSEQQATSFDGSAHFEDISMRFAGMDLTDVQATLGVVVDDTPDREIPRMRFDLVCPSLRVMGRHVTGLRGSADNAERADVLRSSRLAGSLYGGTVVVEAAFGLGDIDRSTFRASIHDVRLEAFMKPEGVTGQTAPGPVEIRDRSTGLISGEVSVSSGYGEEGRRDGRGSIRIEDASLYGDNPLGMGLLSLLNFNLPNGRGFDTGAIDFAIIDDTVLFNRINLRTPPAAITGQALQLNGEGTMAFPDLTLDLRFRTERGGSVITIPFGDVFNSLRSELVGIQVTGTLDEPNVGYTVLQNTRNMLNELLSGRPRGGE